MDPDTLLALSALLGDPLKMAITAVVIPQILQWMKESDLPLFKKWAPETSKYVKTWVGAIAAAAATAGIHIQFVNPEPGVYGWLVTGLIGASITDRLYDFVVQWSMQQIAYEKIVKPKPEAVKIITT